VVVGAEVLLLMLLSLPEDILHYECLVFSGLTLHTQNNEQMLWYFDGHKMCPHVLNRLICFPLQIKTSNKTFLFSLLKINDR
jgi:hypothetical protein